MTAVATETLKLTVHYPAAGQPFKDDAADRHETIGQLKARVLVAFGLTEGSDASGNQISYPLFHEKTPLENPNQTLGELAGHQKVLQLKLSQQITQGDATQELSAQMLETDFADAKTADGSARWELAKPAGLEVLVGLSSSADDKERFQARLAWQQYPDQPPSLKFRDPESGRLDLPTAWPQIRGFRPTTLDACVNWCSEGFAMHPEWKSDLHFRWDGRGNVLLKVIRILQDEFDQHYSGRFKA